MQAMSLPLIRANAQQQVLNQLESVAVRLALSVVQAVWLEYSGMEIENHAGAAVVVVRAVSVAPECGIVDTRPCGDENC